MAERAVKLIQIQPAGFVRYIYESPSGRIVDIIHQHAFVPLVREPRWCKLCGENPESKIHRIKGETK